MTGHRASTTPEEDVQVEASTTHTDPNAADAQSAGAPEQPKPHVATTSGADDSDEQPQAKPDSRAQPDDEDLDEPQRHRRGPVWSAMRWLGRRWVAMVVAVAFTVAAAGASGVYWRIWRPDQQTDAAIHAQVLDAATQATTALLTYSPESFDKDFAGAKTHLTGQFLTYYSQFTEKVVAVAVKQRQVKTSAAVVRAAVKQLTPTRALVLLFVNQVTTNNTQSEPTLATSSILATLVRDRNTWLISEFNPV